MNFKPRFRIQALFIIISLLLANFFGHAQNLKFKRLSIDEGLSAVTVNAIYQDSQDFIWIGTQDGLNRYDGYHFKVFKNDPYSNHSISSNDVKCILEDKKGTMYFGSNGGGLSVYDKYTESFVNYKAGLSSSSLSNNVIRDIIEIDNYELLISTANGVNVFNKASRKFRQIYFGIGEEEIGYTKLFKDSNGTIWVASEGNYMFEYDAKNYKLINYELPAKYQEFDKLNKDIGSRRKTIYSFTQVGSNLVCGSDGGLLFFNLKNKQYVNVFSFDEKNRYNNRVKCFVTPLDSNQLWFGTWGGLVRLNLKDYSYSIETKSETSVNTLSGDKISCIFKDKQNNLWIGTEGNGVNIYFNSLNKFPLYTSNNGLHNDFVYSICQLNNGNVLIGTEDGLYNLNPETNAISDYSSILKKHGMNTVLSLFEENNGNIWIGSYGQGIIVYNPVTKKETRLLADKNLGGTVMKIIQGESGVIWVATYKDGLYSINPNTFAIRRYTTKQGLPSDNIYYVYENKDDNTLMLGTDGGGMCVLDFVISVDKPVVTVYKHIENKNSLSSNVVNSIYKDKNNVFWIATSNGLNKFDKKKKHFVLYTEKDGLPNSYIYDVIPDRDNNLWMPTNFGLSKFNPFVVNDGGSAFKNYNTNDGIQAREFNQGASFLCKDGKILVGGISGLNYFDPAKIKDSKITPRAYVYSYSRQGKNVKLDTNILYTNHLELSHKENYFAFELIALDYVSTEKTKFMYYLEGYDNDWSSPTSVRFVNYTGLQGGDYTFKVKASNSDGVWHEVPTEIKITVTPPWWKTTWFYIVATLLSAALIFGFTSYKTRSIKKVNKILEHKVEERTKELAEKNRDITSSIEYAKRIQEAILPSKDLIYSKLKQIFILYEPKDIVSGDFYWFGEKDNYKIIAMVDCTGHGVPGAFMSMIGHNLLNQIVVEKGYSDPGLILQELHKGVQAALKQGQNQINTNDGMDVSIMAVNTDTRGCLWAGAFRSLVIVNSEGKVEKIDGNKYPVGGAQLDTERVFTTHTRSLKANDCLYMFSDGYADQFGGEKGKKFMVKRFHNNLVAIHHLDVKEQRKQLELQFKNWKGDYEQVDDVLVIGVKL